MYKDLEEISLSEKQVLEETTEKVTETDDSQLIATSIVDSLLQHVVPSSIRTPSFHVPSPVTSEMGSQVIAKGEVSTADEVPTIETEAVSAEGRS